MARNRRALSSKTQKLIGGGLAAVTVVAVTAGLLYDNVRTSGVDVSSSAVAYTPAPPVDKTIPVVPIADVMPRLDDPARAFNVVVLGDSTGAARRGWVIQLAEAMGERTGRETKVHQWSVEQEPDVYLDPYGIKQGPGSPITIWNGSASGENPSYTMTMWKELAPIPDETVDLVIINHGHNVGEGSLATAGALMAKRAAKQFPNAAVATILQNPERPGSVHAEAQDGNVEQLRERIGLIGLPVIDVHTPYTQMPGWESAFDTPTGNLHPDQAGYDLWTNVVRQTLGI
ncbi:MULTISPECIES: SGNH/GDSL hydrolase family protein [unclassified Rhodococcus (in: high G+C Gram-positive bacteria)]|uniref:SGNH/GDSL hydrolase family protein n=1 Tax=unclassified Rhodococcus (in: high G+C Gram-positive bacteria) TaxID=192944 RepID=UPI001179E183|nr:MULTISPECIES: SGNH/GDSL hydrolase family protein [unclassified Rhodococcus (in: high G+C Gram-positive bacteria)]